MKILIATGASGGHIYPALTVAQALRRKGHEVVFVGVFRRWQELIVKEDFRCLELPARPWVAKSLKSMVVSIWCMLKSYRRCLRIIKQETPDAVAGFGGFGSFPVVLAGAVHRLPTSIHEQNVVPGRANKVLKWFVRNIMVSFPESACYFPEKKVNVTGYPLRAFSSVGSRSENRRFFGLQDHVFTIAVCGGSQGSRALNHAMVGAMELLKERFEIQAIHITGKADGEIVDMAYSRMEIASKVFAFFPEMERVYAAADMIIARAGSGMIHEIAHFGLPAVIVPYPFAGGHQKQNALIFVREGKGIMIEEKNLTAARLCGEIEQFSQVAGEGQEGSATAGFLKAGAAEQIAGIIARGVL